MQMQFLARLGVVACAAIGFAASGVAQDGVTDSSVLLGQSAALKGPAAALGTGMQAGMEVAFGEQNAAGGVHGRQIELVSVNDGYEPKRCTVATKLLIEKRKVFALIGGVGTPTAKVAVPIAEEAGVPFLAPFTGAGFLRQSPVVANVRGSYFQEMEELARYLVDEKGMRKIACFYQNDGYGQVGLAGIEKALADRNLELVARGNYKRNTLAIGTGLKEIAAQSPDAVVMVGAYKACAQFIHMAKKDSALAGATFCNISFVGTAALLEELDGNDANCIVSQVVPFPWDDSIPVVKRYHEAMEKAGREGEIGFVSLEGYLAGRFFVEVLERVEGDLTRQSFLQAVRAAGTIDLGGVELTFGEEDNQGLDQVWLTRLEHGKAHPIEQPTVAPAPGK